MCVDFWVLTCVHRVIVSSLALIIGNLTFWKGDYFCVYVIKETNVTDVDGMRDMQFVHFQ